VHHCHLLGLDGIYYASTSTCFIFTFFASLSWPNCEVSQITTVVKEWNFLFVLFVLVILNIDEIYVKCKYVTFSQCW
jgi:hypothetical protein